MGKPTRMVVPARARSRFRLRSMALQHPCTMARPSPPRSFGGEKWLEPRRRVSSSIRIRCPSPPPARASPEVASLRTAIRHGGLEREHPVSCHGIHRIQIRLVSVANLAFSMPITNGNSGVRRSAPAPCLLRFAPCYSTAPASGRGPAGTGRSRQRAP